MYNSPSFLRVNPKTWWAGWKKTRKIAGAARVDQSKSIYGKLNSLLFTCDTWYKSVANWQKLTKNRFWQYKKMELIQHIILWYCTLFDCSGGTKNVGFFVPATYFPLFPPSRGFPIFSAITRISHFFRHHEDFPFFPPSWGFPIFSTITRSNVWSKLLGKSGNVTAYPSQL